MTRPTVSIVVPSYNQGAFLQQTLESLCAQRDQIHELIVMDGGSTDHSVEIIRAYEHQLTHWISEKDEGQADAIARGFDRCSGDLLTWINSDDMLMPGALCTLRDAFAAHPQVSLIEGNTVVIDESDTIVRCDRRVGPSRRWARMGYMRIHQPSTIFRKDLYEQVGKLDPSLHCTMDTDLWYRMLRETRTLRLKQYIGVHRIHDEAKGEHDRWRAKYKAEREILDERYPEFRNAGRVRYQLGRVAYYASRFVTQRAKLERRDTERYKGIKLKHAIQDGGLV